MSMTEKEAKNKLCPFAHNGSWIVYNHGKGGAFTCEASRCMAWEWDYKIGKYEYCDDIHAKVEPQRPPTIPDNWTFCEYDGDSLANWRQPAEENRDNWTGHCHLIYRGAE